MINNRQNGRRRGRGGGQQRPGGGGGQGQRDSGNRIDSRARGNAAQLLEKYKNMARDAQMSGDRVNTEYYLQFADHYFRVLADQRGRGDEQPQRRQRDDFDQFDMDDDFGDEGEPIRADEMTRAQENMRDDRYRNDRGNDGQRDGNQRDGNQRDVTQRDADPRDGRQRDGAQREAMYRDNGRDGGQRDSGQRDSGQRDANQRDGGQRDTGQRENGQRENGQRDARRTGEPQRFQRAVPVANDLDDAEPAAPPAPVAEAAPPVAAEPRRRGRPRKVRDVVEDRDGETAEALGADRLPPALGSTLGAVTDVDEPASDGAEEAPKPRRRRLRAVDATQAG